MGLSCRVREENLKKNVITKRILIIILSWHTMTRTQESTNVGAAVIQTRSRSYPKSMWNFAVSSLITCITMYLWKQYFLTLTTLWKCQILKTCFLRVCVSSLWQLHRARRGNDSRTSYRKRGGYDRDRSGCLSRRVSDPDQSEHLSQEE